MNADIINEINKNEFEKNVSKETLKRNKEAYANSIKEWGSDMFKEEKGKTFIDKFKIILKRLLLFCK